MWTYMTTKKLSAFFSIDVDDAPSGPPKPGTAYHRHGLDAERSPHHKQVVHRQSYY